MSQKEKEHNETDDYLVINMNDLKKLRVSELKEKLSEFGLQTKGTKSELISRLEEHLAAAAESEEELALIDVANTSQQSDSTVNIELDTPLKQKVVCSFYRSWRTIKKLAPEFRKPKSIDTLPNWRVNFIFGA